MTHVTLSRFLKESVHFTFAHFKIFLLIMGIPMLVSLIGFHLTEHLMSAIMDGVQQHMAFWLILDLFVDAILWNLVACLVYANWSEYYAHRRSTILLPPLTKRSFIFIKYSLLFSIPESFLILGIYILFITIHIIDPPSEPIVSYLAHQSLKKEWLLGGFLAAIPYYYIMTRLAFVLAVTTVNQRTTLKRAWAQMTPDHKLVLKLSILLSLGSVLLDRLLFLFPSSPFWLHGERVFHTALETLVFGIIVITCVKLYEEHSHPK